MKRNTSKFWRPVPSSPTWKCCLGETWLRLERRYLGHQGALKGEEIVKEKSKGGEEVHDSKIVDQF